MTGIVSSLLIGFMVDGDLGFKARKGEVFKYDVVMKGVVSGEEFVAQAVVEQKVLKVGKDGYELGTKSKGAVIRFGAEEMRDERANEGRMVFGKDGRLDKFEGRDDISGYRLARITRFVGPGKSVAVGSEWGVDYPAVLGIPELRLDFRLESVGGNGVAKVSYRAKEGKAADRSWFGQGVFMIDVETGVTESVRAELTNWMSEGTKGSYEMFRLKR